MPDFWTINSIFDKTTEILKLQVFMLLCISPFFLLKVTFEKHLQNTPILGKRCLWSKRFCLYNFPTWGSSTTSTTTTWIRKDSSVQIMIFHHQPRFTRNQGAFPELQLPFEVKERVRSLVVWPDSNAPRNTSKWTGQTNGWSQLLGVRLRYPTNPIHHHQSWPMLLAPAVGVGFFWRKNWIFFGGDNLRPHLFPETQIKLFLILGFAFWIWHQKIINKHQKLSKKTSKINKNHQNIIKNQQKRHFTWHFFRVFVVAFLNRASISPQLRQFRPSRVRWIPGPRPWWTLQWKGEWTSMTQGSLGPQNATGLSAEVSCGGFRF